MKNYNAISYQIWEKEKENSYFPIDFKYRHNAILVKDFLEKRDNKKYKIKKLYYMLGIPEYQDYLIDDIKNLI